MSIWRLDIAYDGTEFRGWAKQPEQRTVQGELERALAVVLRRNVAITVAGRTDAGVHAWGQVASFEVAEGEPAISPSELKRSLNALTPPDIAVTGVERAPDGFNARRSAKARRYCYRVDTGSPANPFERGRALWWPYPLERSLLRASAELLLGTHDFTAFTPTKTDHVRFERDIFEARWIEEPPGGSILSFWIEAEAFMRSMVRTLVGTMLEVGGGRRTVEEFGRLLEGAHRRAAGETAPPHGLYLASIRY